MPSASADLRVSSAYPDDQLAWPWVDLAPPLGLQHFGEAVHHNNLGARGRSSTGKRGPQLSLNMVVLSSTVYGEDAAASGGLSWGLNHPHGFLALSGTEQSVQVARAARCWRQERGVLSILRALKVIIKPKTGKLHGWDDQRESKSKAYGRNSLGKHRPRGDFANPGFWPVQC